MTQQLSAQGVRDGHNCLRALGTTALRALTHRKNTMAHLPQLKVETICPTTAICLIDIPYTAGYARYLVGLR